MSVSHNYLCLDWARVPYVNEQGSFDFRFEIEDENGLPDWFQPVPFSDELDDYRFSSWHGFMEFKEWFLEASPLMDPALVKDFTSLYQDLGLLMNDDYAYVPIRKDIVVDDDWLLGAIPPAQVAELHQRSLSLNRVAVKSEFQKALDATPSDMYQTGESVADWLDAVRCGLEAVVKKPNFGIVLGAA